MASSYSPLLRLELIGAGEQTALWGETTNKNLGTLLEQAIAGVTSISLSGGTGVYALTTLNGTQDQARSAVLYFIGDPSGEKVIEIPAIEKLYVARNDCGQKIIFRTPAQVSNPNLGGVELLDGEASLVFCDGEFARAGIQTSDVGTLTVSGGGTGQTSFTAGFLKSPGGTGALTSSTTVSLTTDVSGTLPVASGGTGRTSLTAGRVLVGNGTAGVNQLAGNSIGQVLTWSGSAWQAANPVASGVASFNGRTGPVTSVPGDYDQFFPSLSSSYSNPSWISSLAGSKITGTVSSANTANTAANATNAETANFASTAGFASSADSAQTAQTAQSAQTANSATTASSANTANTANNANFATTAGSVSWTSVTNKPSLVTTNNSQTITGFKTFTAGLQSQAYNLTSNTSMFFNNTQIEFAVVGNFNRARLDANGNLFIAGSLTQNSDIRLKDNVTDYTNGLVELNQIKVRSWVFNGKGGTDEGKVGVGVIADEIESVLPSVVKVSDYKLNPDDAEPTGIKAVASEEVTWLAVKAIQELSAKVTELEDEIAALKGQ